MKYTGGVLVWLAFSVLGAFACERLSRRVKALEGVLRLLKKTELEIRQFSRPLPQLAEIIADEEKGDGLAAECVRFLKAGESFPSAWQKGTEKSPLPFKSGERKMLSFLGRELSSCDREGCFQVLEVYFERFSSLLEEAKSAKAKYSKLCLFSGVFVGGMIFISIS